MPALEARFKVSQLSHISSASGSLWTPGHLELVRKMSDAFTLPG